MVKILKFILPIFFISISYWIYGNVESTQFILLPGNIDYNTEDSSKFFNEHRGFNSQIEIMIGKATFHRNLYSFRFINGYKFKNRYFIGLGIGITYTSNYYGSLHYIRYFSYPILTRFSYDLTLKKSRPYLFTDFGLQLQTKNSPQCLKPLNIKFGIGYKYNLKKNVLYTSLGYSYCNARYYYYYENKYGLSDWYRNHAVEFNLGVQFN